jgi:hypothetical protein
MTAASTPAPSPSTGRQVGVRLMLGIALFPYLFVWTLLRRGYSTRARLLGFGYFAALIIVGMVLHLGG